MPAEFSAVKSCASLRRRKRLNDVLSRSVKRTVSIRAPPGPAGGRDGGGGDGGGGGSEATADRGIHATDVISVILRAHKRTGAANDVSPASHAADG